MTKYIFTDEALAHINNIRNYTRNKWGKRQTAAYLTKLSQTLKQLAENPQIGTKRDQEVGYTIYSFPVLSHTIYYQTHDDHILIVAVLHQSMTPEIHLR